MNRHSAIVTEAPNRPVSDPGGCAVKVMIVDDESISTRLLQAFLEDVGYSRFVITNRSTETISLLLEEHPDALLLRLQMPELDGLKSSRRCAAPSPEIHTGT